MKKSLLILISCMLSTTASTAFDYNYEAYNFGAPTVTDSNSIYAPRQGDIIFQSSSGTDGNFKGYDGDQWVDLSLGNTTASYLSSTSSILTPSASGYQTLTGNSITLTQGTWIVSAVSHFESSGGGAAYTLLESHLSTVNGSGSAPTVQTGKPNATFQISGATLSDMDISIGPVRIETSSNLTLYVVPRTTLGTPSNSRIIGYIYAEKVR